MKSWRRTRLGDVVVGHPDAVDVAKEVLEQHLHRVRQPFDVELVAERPQAVDLVPFAAGLERVADVDRSHGVHLRERGAEAEPIGEAVA